jgi:hypothetical protein
MTDWKDTYYGKSNQLHVKYDNAHGQELTIGGKVIGRLHSEYIEGVTEFTEWLREQQ